MSIHKDKALTGKRGYSKSSSDCWERCFGKKNKEPKPKAYDDKLHSK